MIAENPSSMAISTPPTPSPRRAGKGPRPLCAGDCLTLEEFIAIWDQHPEIKFAELIGGVVFMPSCPSPDAKPGVRPLCMGDSLSLEEFIEIWDQHPEIKFAELIEGIVYMPSPLSREHANLQWILGGILWDYVFYTPGVEANDNASTIISGLMPQPDLQLRIQKGGSSAVVGKYVQGPPEFVAEVCVSSASYDTNQKRKLYESAGVMEYLAILAHEEEVRWTALVNGTYRDLAPSVDGVWKSRVFPGLWLHEEAFWNGDFARLRATVNEGLASPEHRAFVEQLAARNSADGGKP